MPKINFNLNFNKKGVNMNYYVEVLTKKYAQFSGRARRSEFWFFVLFNFIASMVLGFIDGFIGYQILSGIYSLAVLVPSIAVWVRRLHDTGKSGWWLLLALVPIVGVIVLLVFAVMDSVAGENQYGANPKGA